MEEADPNKSILKINVDELNVSCVKDSDSQIGSEVKGEIDPSDKSLL